MAHYICNGNEIKLVFHSTEPQDNVVERVTSMLLLQGRKPESDRWKIASSAETGEVSESRCEKY
jgi:hypothetical protein